MSRMTRLLDTFHGQVFVMTSFYSREAIQYEVMQECLVSAVVKHLGLQETVRYFTPSKEQQTDDFMLLSSVMEEVCRRFDALIRQLQVL